MSPVIPHSPRLRPLLATFDVAALATSIRLSHLVRFSAADRPQKWAELLHHPGLIVVAVLALWAFATAAELYEPLLVRRRGEATARVLVVALLWGGTLALATYLVPSWRFGRGLLLLTTLAWAVAALAARALVAHWLTRRPRPRALVVGERERVGAVCRTLSEHPLVPWEPVDGSGIAAADVPAEARRHGAELVVLVEPERAGTDPGPDLAALLFSAVPVVVASEVWAWLDGRLPVAELSPAAFLHQPGFGAIHWVLFNRFTRVLDVVLGAVLLAVVSPVLLLVAAAVLVFSGRPVLYGQTRVGQFGRRFLLLKLRTMRRDAERAGPTFAEPDDPRVTPVGRILRRLRLDELPQLWNVLRGDMSLVGPRPERPEFVAELARTIPYYTFRLAVPPGLTGWAQVNMPYARTTEEHRRKLEYDLYFVRERSVGMYLLILLRTASAALVGARR